MFKHGELVLVRLLQLDSMRHARVVDMRGLSDVMKLTQCRCEFYEIGALLCSEKPAYLERAAVVRPVMIPGTPGRDSDSCRDALADCCGVILTGKRGEALKSQHFEEATLCAFA